MADIDVIQKMVDDLPAVIENLDLSITKIDTTINTLQGQQDAIEDFVQSNMVTASDAWIVAKKNELNPTYVVCTSGNYGITNLTEWAIVTPSCTPPLTIIYSDVDVTSGAPSAAETQQYNRQLEFPILYDFIYDDLSVDGTYGLDDKIDKLDTAKSLQQKNRTMYEDVLKSLSKYV